MKYILLVLTVLVVFKAIKYTKRHGFSMLIQVIFRPIIRYTVSIDVQYNFSAWVTAMHNAHINFRRNPSTRALAPSNWVDSVFHRLYWVFNPRGETNRSTFIKTWYIRGSNPLIFAIGRVYVTNTCKRVRTGRTTVYQFSINVKGYGLWLSYCNKENYCVNDEY